MNDIVDRHYLFIINGYSDGKGLVQVSAIVLSLLTKPHTSPKIALLESAAVDVYGNRLRRRRQKKRVVGELGLLNRTRVASRPSQYHRLFSSNKGWIGFYTSIM